MNNKTSSHRSRNIDPMVIFSEDIMKLFDRGAEAIANELRAKLGEKDSKTGARDCGCEGDCGTACKCATEIMKDAMNEKASGTDKSPLLIVRDKRAAGTLPFGSEVDGNTVTIKIPTLFRMSPEQAVVEVKEMKIIDRTLKEKNVPAVSVRFNPVFTDQKRDMVNDTLADMIAFFGEASLNVTVKDGYEIVPGSVRADIAKDFQGLNVFFEFKPKTKEQNVFRITIN